MGNPGKMDEVRCKMDDVGREDGLKESSEQTRFTSNKLRRI